jgi:hypothetical protein
MRRVGKHAGYRSQAALQYLINYGWAILVLAFILAALSQLGLFGAFNFSVRAQPGSCQILRTGLGSSASPSGTCNGELPQFVAQYTSSPSSYVMVPAATPIQITPATPFSFTFWINDNNALQQQVVLIKANEYAICTAGTSTKLVDLHSHVGMIATSISSNKWYFFAVTFSTPATGGSNTVTVYINGASQGSANIGNWGPTTGDTSPLYLGDSGISACSTTTGFTGQMANVQMYNTTLSASEVQTLYASGIGSAPIYPQTLVGWWPLNGNGNDYSGYGSNGKSTGVTFINQWLTGYTVP